jgi:hypothetical protein
VWRLEMSWEMGEINDLSGGGTRRRAEKS